MQFLAVCAVVTMALALVCARVWRKVAMFYTRRRMVAVLSACAIAGISAGYPASTELSYVIGDRIRFIGAPLPVAVFVYEDAGWVDYVPSAAGGLLRISGNIVMVTAAFTLVALLAMYGWRRGWRPRSETRRNAAT